MIITDAGTLVRTRVDEISVVGRNTQGVTVIKLNPGEKVVGVDRIANLPDGEEDIENAEVEDSTASDENDEPSSPDEE